MESHGICTNIFIEEPLERYHNGGRAVNKTKTPIHFPEAESIFPSMFGNLIDRRQNAFGTQCLQVRSVKL